jgi:hypothetical protein
VKLLEKEPTLMVGFIKSYIINVKTSNRGFSFSTQDVSSVSNGNLSDGENSSFNGSPGMINTNLKYSNILQIFYNHQSEMKEIVDFIVHTDEECDSLVLHKQIELNLQILSKLSEESTVSLNNSFSSSIHSQLELGRPSLNLMRSSIDMRSSMVSITSSTQEQIFEISSKILQLIKHKKYQHKIDKEYILMLFKMHHFKQGIIVLSELMELRNELLSIYMETYDFEKIIQICENFGRKKPSYYYQALNFFITNYDGGVVYENYIKHLLEKILQYEVMPSVLVLEILKKNESLKYSVVKDYLMESITKEGRKYEESKKITDLNKCKIQKIENEIKETIQKAKTFNMSKCSSCTMSLTPPAIYFLCNHAYHINCINANTKDDDLEKASCPECYSSILILNF